MGNKATTFDIARIWSDCRARFNGSTIAWFTNHHSKCIIRQSINIPPAIYESEVDRQKVNKETVEGVLTPHVQQVGAMTH